MLQHGKPPTMHRGAVTHFQSASNSISARQLRSRQQPSVRAAEQKDRGDSTKEAPGLGLKAIWNAADQYSSIIGRGQRKPSVERRKHISREDALASIRQDYEKNYFVSGDGAMEAYDPECRFADDFAAFTGLEKFQRNVSSLGSLTEDVDLKVAGWDERKDSLKAKWRFSAVLSLPWRPRLAAAGATTYVFDKQTGLVIDHIEEWDVEPKKVLQQLLLPANRQDQNTWERFMGALGRGRLVAALGVISRHAFLLSVGALALFTASRFATGDAFPPGWLTNMVYAVLFAAAGTEAAKLLQNSD